jgi:hypothetical protein
MRFRLTLALVLAAPLVFAPEASHAADTAEDQAAATALFNEAKALVEASNLPAACEKFALSLKFEKRVGTTLNLADCYEKIGRTASAWARFNEAAILAQRSNQVERMEFARAHVAALEPTLVRMVVAPSRAVEGMVVLRDGVSISPEVYGVSVPVDPGKHVLEARAPLKMPWSREVFLTAEQKQTDVIVPALADDVEAIARARARAEADAAKVRPERFWTGQRIVGVATAALGVAGVAAGTVFGLDASSKWSDAKALCDGAGCDPAGVSLGKDAASAGNLSTAGFVAGGVLVAAGAFVFLTGGAKAPAQKKGLVVSPSVGLRTAGVALGASF